MRHYIRAAQRGARRFDSQGDLEGMAHVGFVNPDGTKALVIRNTGATRKTQWRLSSMMAEISLPGESITNLSWV